MPHSHSDLARELHAFEARHDYDALIDTLRQRIADNPRTVTDPAVKAWMARRWRNLFLQEAVKDRQALLAAGRTLGLGRDRRPPAQRIAERFLKGEHLHEWSLDLPAARCGTAIDTTLVFCPGFINGMLPAHAFAREFPELEAEYGWKILQADAHPMRSCDANVEDVVRAVTEGKGFQSDPGAASDRLRHGPAPDDVFLMGYSKGAPDILTALVQQPELLQSKVRCVVSWAGAIGGSYMADNFHALVKDLDTDTVTARLHDLLQLLAPGLVRKGSLRRLGEYDVRGGVGSLTTAVRGEFLKAWSRHLDEMNIPVLTFTGATTPLEVPTFQMADCINLSRYDGNNDMQVTQEQAKLDIPMATHIAMLHGHHWDIAYPPFPRGIRLTSPNLDHRFPRKAALVAIWLLLAELGLID